MKDWINDYVCLRVRITDAPPIWAPIEGLVQLSTTLDNVWLDFGPKPLGANLMVTLIGNSYDTRKGTIDSIILDVLPLDRVHDLDDFSPEGLRKIIENKLLRIDEYGSFLTASKYVKYRMETISILKKIKNRQRFSKQLSSGPTPPTQPYMPMIMYSTPTQMRRALTIDEVEDGFVGRGLHIWGHRTRFLPKRQLTAEEKASIADLCRRLEDINNPKGPKPAGALLSAEAEKRFNEIQIEREKTRKMNSPAYNAVSGRYLDEGVLQCAMCFAWSRQLDDWTNSGKTMLIVELCDIEKAYTLVRYLLRQLAEKTFPELFVSIGDRIMKIVEEEYERNGYSPVLYKVLLQRMNKPTAELKPEVETLKDLEELLIDDKGRGWKLIPVKMAHAHAKDIQSTAKAEVNYDPEAEDMEEAPWRRPEKRGEEK